jgi:hypothetical protein
MSEKSCKTCLREYEERSPAECHDCGSAWKKWLPIPATIIHNSQAPTGPLAVQVDGDHYKNMPIQPIEFCQRNKLGFCESNVVKYICRHKSKNGARDIHKAIHNLQILLKLEYGEEA